MTRDSELRFNRVLSRVNIPGFDIALRRDGDRAYLQLQWEAPDIVEFMGGFGTTPTEQHGRKWMLSPHMTDGEIIQTALKAYLAVLEHEARESFTVDGCAVFGPHLDVDALVGMMKDAKLATVERGSSRD